ncbi:hypothetical protein NQ318_021369 [Aromia moschata]|uniref:VWFC domain-containing protein n=1 Tax=Aromia moschata TaxID=1265417 RepID=A0AAV8ZC28_9CUCU|nr:hypothetical protein NQ318_021369 [Aromia moschata]
MRYDKYIWVTVAAVTFLGTTSEARTRRRVKVKPQADDPNVQDQQPSNGNYDYELPNYDEYLDYVDNGTSIAQPVQPGQPVTTPQPPDERPWQPTNEDDTTEIFVQPESELPTAKPTSKIDVHIVTTPTPESNVVPFTCKHDGRFFQDKEKWKVGECTVCACVQGKVECQTDEECEASLRPTREPHIDVAAAPGRRNN